MGGALGGADDFPIFEDHHHHFFKKGPETFRSMADELTELPKVEVGEKKKMSSRGGLAGYEVLRAAEAGATRSPASFRAQARFDTAPVGLKDTNCFDRDWDT
jgi:hypothetical protein